MTKVVLNKRTHQVRVRDLRGDKSPGSMRCMMLLMGNRKGLEARSIPVTEVLELLERAWHAGYDECAERARKLL